MEVHNIVQEAVKPLLFGIFLTSKIDLAQARYPFGVFINTCIFLSHKWIHVWVCGWFFSLNNTVHSLVLITFHTSFIPTACGSFWPSPSLHPHCHPPSPSHHCCCSVAKSCPAPCDPTDCSTPGFPVLHYLSELAQTHVYWVGDAIQLSRPLSSPFHALNLSQHQGLFQWVSSLHQVAKVLELQLQYQSFQWIFRVDFL